MNLQKYDRFKDAPWFSEEQVPVLIGGAGGIGSWLTLFLTRAGFQCHVYDFDILEAINMAGQCFRYSDIGSPKVDALANVVKELCSSAIFTYNEAVDNDTMTNNIVLTAFDNIKARRIMFESWVNGYGTDPTAIFIDGRLMAEQKTIFCVRGGDPDAIDRYLNQHLPDDTNIPDAPCTFKQVSHNAAAIAAEMTAYLTNFISIVNGKDPSRAVPFYTEHYTAIDYRKQDMVAKKKEVMVEPPAKEQSTFEWDIPHDGPFIVGEVNPFNEDQQELMTLEQVVDKFGHMLSSEEIDELKKMTQEANDIAEITSSMNKSMPHGESSPTNVTDLIIGTPGELSNMIGAEEMYFISTDNSEPEAPQQEDNENTGPTNDIGG